MLSKGLRKEGKVERLFAGVGTPLLLKSQIYRDLRQADHFTIRPIKRVISCHQTTKAIRVFRLPHPKAS